MLVEANAALGVEFVPLINSGESPFGTTFRGIPDGIGVVPGPANSGWVDLYVAHEESHVPFGTTAATVFADHQDASVTRVRVEIATRRILDTEVALPASAGFVRFCSAFMAGPEHGFPHYTFLLNEESNDVLPVPAGAPYGSDRGTDPGWRQGGYAVYLDTRTGKFDEIAGAGRHNHENTIVVPGGWKQIVTISGDDTFRAPSSQLYMYNALNWKQFQKDAGTLWAFRVTATGQNPGDAIEGDDLLDPLNDANDYLDIVAGNNWRGEFIRVPDDIARGTTEDLPQTALEDWSNDNNIFQFIRVEDTAYDPDNPRDIYIADTGTNRLREVDGRLTRRTSSSDVPHIESDGRIFKMTLNAADPRKVDSFSIVAQGRLRETTTAGASPTTLLAGDGFRQPDNLDVGKNSLMLQEDPANTAKIWMHPMGTAIWTHIATVDQDVGPTLDEGESSGIVDVSRWFGPGWWALDVQGHQNVVPGTLGPSLTWPTERSVIPGGQSYKRRLEEGQLLLMRVPGS